MKEATGDLSDGKESDGSDSKAVNAPVGVGVETIDLEE